MRSRRLLHGRLIRAAVTGAAVFSLAVFSLIDGSFAAARAATTEQPKRLWIAQAGSSGGSVVQPESIGKKGKSISSQPSPKAQDAPTRSESPRPAKLRRPARAKSSTSRCPNIAGVWSSWASGFMGKNDTTFGSDGSATHRSGIRGKWWCANGQLHIEWPDGKPGVVRLSDDRRSIISGDGRVHMKRE
jgi:hypothetical protein